MCVYGLGAVQDVVIWELHRVELGVDWEMGVLDLHRASSFSRILHVDMVYGLVTTVSLMIAPARCRCEKGSRGCRV